MIFLSLLFGIESPTMQIDFHHAVTYVAARLAGFEHARAEIIAYSAQYVDDATNTGYVAFDNRSMYYRTASAHKMLDYKNFDELANHHAWIPFHFLPGNNGLPPEQGQDLSFIDKIICTPNSHVAREMVRECIRRRSDAHALQRLGITMHAYVDTWAHQGFAGITHKVNDTSDLRNSDDHTDHSLKHSIGNYFGETFDAFKSRFVGDALPLGHGSVLSHPDKPFLRWSYVNGLGKEIVRDNPTDFLEAAEYMCKALQCFRAGDPDMQAPGLPAGDRQKMDELLRNTRAEDGEARHKVWLAAIQDGVFSFGAAQLEYIPKGVNSWKHAALNTTEFRDEGNEIFPYQPAFLNSNWKRFHDALQTHRLYVEHDLLPKYGICAA